MVRAKSYYVEIPIHFRVVAAEPGLAQDDRVVPQLRNETWCGFMVVRDVQSQLGEVCDRA
jgi:hypothetical protein